MTDANYRGWLDKVIDKDEVKDVMAAAVRHEGDRFWRILIAEMVGKLVAIDTWRERAWRERGIDGDKAVIHDLEMELSGLLGFAVVAFREGTREELLAFAKRTAPWNPATAGGLAELKKRGVVGWC